MSLNIVYALTMIIIPYFIIVICYIKISEFLQNHKHSLSSASRRVQIDLNRILVIQAIIPIVFILIPLGIQFLGAVTDLDLTFETFISGIIYCWIPVGNAITVIFFVTSYRKKLRQLFIHAKVFLHFTPAPTTVSFSQQ